MAIVIPVLCAPLRPLPVRVRRFGVALRLIATVLHDVVASNVEIGWRVLHARSKPPRGAFVRMSLETPDIPAPPKTTAIACRGVTKEFGSGDALVRALRGIDLDVYSGELSLLVGPR